MTRTIPPQLFNVLADPLEQQDLSTANPALVAALQMRVGEWELAEEPGLPVYEILFDPDTFGGEEDRAPWPDVVED